MSPEQDIFLEKLHRKYFNKLTIYAASSLGNANKAQDIVQDTFRVALLRIDDLMGHENPGGWLMETVKNKVREEKRARQRYMCRFLSLNTDIPIGADPKTVSNFVPDGPDTVSSMEIIEQLLTPEDFHLLKRLALDGASHLEVAQELGISVSASAKRLQRIREKLYQAFPERKRKKKK